ncbi:DUF4157 domain-containing protein [Shewanella sp. UCD-KL12]|uniref:eCIS core domain-containing protein n=1 Tax=Shewanella sp. UCD-KL12 TaxID=1917163 RepID=UPI0009F99F48|nr:DUF4157 domain-containing protein [Shewanella sp. UCD-KL12]
MSVKQGVEQKQTEQAKTLSHKQVDSNRTLQAKTRLTMQDNRHTSQQIKQLKSALDEEGVSQHKSVTASHSINATSTETTLQAKNNTGLPDNLKSGMENLSGMPLDDVKVHRNSSKPAQLQAHAYAQGTDIHLGPGQEKHLPHEAWHVVQQKQGRVSPTKQLKGKVNINDDSGLEKEADVMGAKALQFVLKNPNGDTIQKKNIPTSTKSMNTMVIQRNLDNHVLAGNGSGMLGNVFGTSTFSNIHKALGVYQSIASSQSQKKEALSKIKNLGSKWMSDNSKKVDVNSVTKRTSLKQLLSLVGDELSRINDNSLLQKGSINFEKNLGLYTFNENRSKAAATGAINKMKQVMGVQADRTIAGEIFGGDSSKYAGVVGKDVDTVIDAIDNGNLREKMTGFYNAALGPFKKMLDEHIKLKGAMNGHDWTVSKASLGTKGINATGRDAIEERKNQIESYDNTSSTDIIYNGAKATGKIDKYKDVYMAPLDPIYRDGADALKQGQRGVIASEGRMDAMDAALKSPGSYHFNWDLVNYGIADLEGTASGIFDKTSTFKTVQTELGIFLSANSQSNEKIISYNKLKSSTEKWLKDNDSKTDQNSLTKKASLQKLETELKKVYGSSDRADADLTNGTHSAHLSNREKAFIASQRVDLSKQDDSNIATFKRLIGMNVPNVYDPSKNLPWEEGGTRFAPNPDNAWVNKAIHELKMPVVAGPSGTTDRMLRALKFLGNPVSPVNFRLSLLGWMLTSNDHSFHEIMAVSKSFGLSYDEGTYAYHNIMPLSIPDLRQHVCDNRMFPDELVYYSHLNDFILMQDSIDQPLLGDSFDPQSKFATLGGGLNQQMSPASSASIALYTTASYLIQNPAKQNSEMVAGIKIGSHLKNKDELATLKGKQDANPEQFSISKLIAEGKVHNAALENALKDLPDTAHNPVYRGQNDGILSSYKTGQTISYNKFMSTSLQIGVADGFMNAPTKTNTPVLFKIDVNKGKDIRPFSKYAEGEILLMPGTKLNITAISPSQPAGGGISKVHTKVDCTQV